MLPKVFYQTTKICVGTEAFLEPAEFRAKLQNLQCIVHHDFSSAAVHYGPGVLGQPVNFCRGLAGRFGGVEFVEHLPGAGPLGSTDFARMPDWKTTLLMTSR